MIRQKEEKGQNREMAKSSKFLRDFYSRISSCLSSTNRSLGVITIINKLQTWLKSQRPLLKDSSIRIF